MHCNTPHCTTLDCTTVQCNVLQYTALYCPAGVAVLVAYRGFWLSRHFTASPAALRTIYFSKQYSALMYSLLCTLLCTVNITLLKRLGPSLSHFLIFHLFQTSSYLSLTSPLPSLSQFLSFPPFIFGVLFYQILP